MSESFAERMRRCRAEKGILQDELGTALGLTRASINRYESAAYYPSLSIAIQISRYLGFSLDGLTFISAKELKAKKKEMKIKRLKDEIKRLERGE